MTALQNLMQHFQDRFFDAIVSNHLVYNTCWEDPRIDRQLLQIDQDSSIVMLTSAGCNALDYLIDEPKSIFAIDANPNQNAVLDFKKALFRNGSHELLFDFFGHGSYPAPDVVYEQLLIQHLSAQSRVFWDKNINYFSRTSTEPSFYFRSTSGKIALMVHRLIKRKGLYGKALNLLDSTSLREQRYYFEEIEPLLWSGFYRWLLKRDSVMAFLGVPSAQRGLIEAEFDGGLIQFIKTSLNHVFTELPIHDNYFWRVYITGSYTPGCCPGYLQKKHFEILKNNIDRIQLFTTTLSDFLERNPGTYSHFILLDHQDWMANSQPNELEREWKLLLKNAQNGTRILFRSAGREINFLPEFIHDHVYFDESLTERLHQKSRVGTYGSTHLGIVI